MQEILLTITARDGGGKGGQNGIFSLCLISLRSVRAPRASSVTPPALPPEWKSLSR